MSWLNPTMIWNEAVMIAQKIPLPQVIITIAMFIGAWLISGLFKRMTKRYFSKRLGESNSFWARFWKKERRFILRSIGWVIWIAFFGAALFVWAGHLSRMAGRLEAIYVPLGRAAVIIIIALLTLKATRVVMTIVLDQLTPIAGRGMKRAQRRMETLNHVFNYGITFAILGITVMMLLDTFGIDLKAVLATVGVASVAIGFGAQSLVKDFISGIFILTEDQYGVGDVVNINGESGFVERMTLRMTQLRNMEGILITVPHGSITNVKNMTSTWSRVDYTIGVGYATDLDHALDVLMEEAEKLRADYPNEIIEAPERIGVDEFGDSSITIRILIKTAPLKQWMMKRELNRRIHKRFEAEKIEIPFPQRTLWIREPKEEILAKLAEKHA